MQVFRQFFSVFSWNVKILTEWEMEWEIRERLGRDSDNLSLLRVPVFMRLLRDLVRDGEIFIELFINLNLIFCSDYVYELFRLSLQVVRTSPYSMFPTWEQFIPKEGTSRSHDGNKCKKQLSRIIIWRNEGLCVPLPDYIVVVECICNNSRHCVRILFFTKLPNSRPCRLLCGEWHHFRAKF